MASVGTSYISDKVSKKVEEYPTVNSIASTSKNAIY